MSSIDNIFFDIENLKAPFNKKINLVSLFLSIKNKFSTNEITKYAFASYFKRKRNCVLTIFTNEKIFIVSNKKDLPICGIYSYQDIKKIEFIEKSYDSKVVIVTSTDSYALKGVSKKTYEELDNVFESEKTIFLNSKIGQNIVQSFNNFNSLNFIDNSEEEKNNDLLNLNYEQQEEKIIPNTNNKKSKRVVNDEMISKSTSLSSFYIIELLSNPNLLLPNNKASILKSIDERLTLLETSNLFNKPLDSIPLKFSSISKFNTIPVLAEFSSLLNPQKTENRLLFSRNWIEFTKHNVKNKLLGVDANGNGAYIDINTANKLQVIDVFKGKEYIINEKTRYGIRPGQTIPLKDEEGKQGLETLYYHSVTNEKLDISKYDGIIFKNQKYFFNVPTEFNTLNIRECKIQVQEYESDYKAMKLYELIITDETITYNLFDLNKGIIDDKVQHSDSYDIKWITFFKE